MLHKLNAKVYKITLDAGFNCPNRDGTISKGGCIFCDEEGSFSRVHSSKQDIEDQIKASSEFLRNRFKAEKFLSYFQAYTNTYASIAKLKEIYDSSLSHPDVIGLSIGTRPDCVDPEKIKLLAGYAKDYYVCVEYGLQSIHDKTLKLINRGHDAECFLNAVKMTQNKNIKICAHIILGLPKETKKDMLETAKTLADLNIDGVKIHALSALKGTQLTKMYENKEWTPLEEDDYIDIVCDILEILPPKTTIHRLTGSGLHDILVAPMWLGSRHYTLNKIHRELERRDSWQGKFYKK